ncbi:MAG: YkgJ family cysteine cluster protein [Candidatus Aenigmarchaeota archaeon]|nr:YkgJ family cysteine cluster protein [Candidatus Aenigmarchaeota archaeon]
MKGFSWSCDLCGQCCSRNWRIALTEADISVLSGLGYDQKMFLRKLNGKNYIKTSTEGCPFSLESGLCSIHIKHGFEKKPELCRKFPIKGYPCGKLEICEKKAPLKTDRTYFYKKAALSQKVLDRLYKGLNPENYHHFLIGFVRHLEECSRGVTLFSGQDLEEFLEMPDKRGSPCQGPKARLFLAKHLFGESATPKVYLPQFLLKSGKIELAFPFKKISVDYQKIAEVTLSKATVRKFLTPLRQEVNPVSDDLSKQAAIFGLLPEVSKALAESKVTLENMLDAYVHLGSIFKFRY